MPVYEYTHSYIRVRPGSSFLHAYSVLYTRTRTALCNGVGDELSVEPSLKRHQRVSRNRPHNRSASEESTDNSSLMDSQVLGTFSCRRTFDRCPWHRFGGLVGYASVPRWLLGLMLSTRGPLGASHLWFAFRFVRQGRAIRS